jgi:hypothetical protein
MVLPLCCCTASIIPSIVDYGVIRSPVGTVGGSPPAGGNRTPRSSH